MSVDAPRFWEEVRLGEDTGLELKEARFRGQQVSAPHRDGLADEFAAFANSGGGRLVLGVADDRKPQSLDPTRLDALANLVTEICSDSVEPPLDFSMYRVPALPPGGGGVLLVEVPAGDTVHRSPGGYFRRRGDTKRQMLPDEIRRLLQSRGQSDAAATDTQVIRNTGVNSLRPELWQRYASSRTNDPVEIVLTKLKFLKDDQHGALRATVGGSCSRRRSARVAVKRVHSGGLLRRQPYGRQSATGRPGHLTSRYETRCGSTGASRPASSRLAAMCPSTANVRSSRRW